MHLAHIEYEGRVALACRVAEGLVDLTAAGSPASLDEVLNAGPEALAALTALVQGIKTVIPVSAVTRWLPPVLAPSKAIAIGLNYADHAAEGNSEIPTYPVVFSRFPSSWVGHNAPIIKPRASVAFDYEAEMVVVIGKSGRHIAKPDALDHVAGYSIFNEGSARDFQSRTHQWTIGKNFDQSGGFGPWFVTADELPAGASGLRIQTRINGRVLQDANTRDMIFDVATLVSVVSEVMALSPGDIIISGTPAGVGFSHNPPVWMQPGDVCEIEIEAIGILSNPIKAE
jgi:2-keto-4-pentenoate hydratase/2-oxohepta-3-ene-1,7-dioic acid hydratase in catechol pathway